MLVITRPFTVLFHELGHAIPIILMTREETTIYVGSYGDKRHSINLSLGSLNIWIRYNPLGWRGGLCQAPVASISVQKQIIYLLGGVLFSLFISIIFFLLTFAYDLHGALKLMSSFGLASAILDIYSNLIPRAFHANNTDLYSDGYQIAKIWKNRKFSEEWAAAVETFTQKDYQNTVTLFEDFFARGLINESVYRILSLSYLHNGEIRKAYSLQKEFETKYPLTADDYYSLAYTCLKFDLPAEHADYLRKSLDINPNHSYSLNSLGYECILKGEFQQAIAFFDKALSNQADFAYAYNNRGHAKLELGLMDEGLQDIQRSLSLDDNNAFVYRNLGIYHLIKGENELALQYFEKSRQMDATTEFIDEYISRAKGARMGIQLSLQPDEPGEPGNE